MALATTETARLSLRVEQARWQLALPDGGRRLLSGGDFDGRDNAALVRWLAADRQLADRLLNWCNSRLYNRSRPFHSLEEAAGILDQRDLARLAMLAFVRGMFLPDVVIDCYSRELLWRHSIAVGAVAAMIARTCGCGDPSLVMVAGTLHDIGLYASERLDQQAFSQLVFEIDELTPTTMIERELFGWDHTELGAEILNQWGMPEAVQMASRLHHHPERAVGSPFETTVCCVSIANHLCSRSGWASMGSHNVTAPSPATFQCLGIDAEVLTVLWQQLYAVLEAAAELR